MSGFVVWRFTWIVWLLQLNLFSLKSDSVCKFGCSSTTLLFYCRKVKLMDFWTWSQQHRPMLGAWCIGLILCKIWSLRELIQYNHQAESGGVSERQTKTVECASVSLSPSMMRVCVFRQLLHLKLLKSRVSGLAISRPPKWTFSHF